MSKEVSRWYLLLVAILLALIVLVGVAGIISYRTRVVQPKDGSQEVKLASSKSADSTKRVAFYLLEMVDDEHFRYVDVPRQVSVDKDGMTNLIKELLDYTQDKSTNTFTLIPEDTKLQSMHMEGDLLTVDFSEEFRFNSMGSQGYEAQLGQLLRTLASVSPSRYVQITIDGKKVDFLHEGIYIGLPIDLELYRTR